MKVKTGVVIQQRSVWYS